MIVKGTVEAVPFFVEGIYPCEWYASQGCRLSELRTPNPTPPSLRDTSSDRKVSQRAFLSFFLRFSFFIDKEDGE